MTTFTEGRKLLFTLSFGWIIHCILGKSSQTLTIKWWIKCLRDIQFTCRYMYKTHFMFFEQFWNGCISFIFQFIHNFLFTLQICKRNIQEMGTTNKMVLYCFCSFETSYKMSRVILKCAKCIWIGNPQEVCSDSRESFLQTFIDILTKMSEDYFLKIKRL